MGGPAIGKRLRLLGAAISVVMLATLAGPGSAEAASGSAISVSTVCFTVQNPTDPIPGSSTTLYGLRYSQGPPTSSEPAIVLVHGVASSTANWDFLPGWSVARSLARRGFLVISYDRLGFDKSTYNRPKGGDFATTPSQVDILHQVVSEVKSGGYAAAGGVQSSCAGVSGASGVANPTVAIAGHSAGGAIVQGYPGKYHDVAAMVQSNYSNQGSGKVVTDQLTSVVAPAIATGADYVPFFANRQQCQNFNIYEPGDVDTVVQVACDPAHFVLTPTGEWTGILALQQENNQFIKTTGSIPVLLAYGDQDAAFPPATADQDYNYWKANCPGCDITRYTEPSTGHLFMAHQSMTGWVTTVVCWLGARGIAPPGGQSGCPAHG